MLPRLHASSRSSLLDPEEVDGPEPQADGPESQADGSDPQADGFGPQADGPDSQADGSDPQANCLGPQADGAGPKVGLPTTGTPIAMPTKGALVLSAPS